MLGPEPLRRRPRRGLRPERSELGQVTKAGDNPEEGKRFHLAGISPQGDDGEVRREDEDAPVMRPDERDRRGEISDAAKRRLPVEEERECPAGGESEKSRQR